MDLGPSIFISYKRDHAASAGMVVEIEGALIDRGLRVLRDVGIEVGTRWPDELWRYLLSCTAAVVVLSEEAATSDWCRREWAVLAARHSQAGLTVVPVRVDGTGRGNDLLDHLQALDAGPRTAEAVAARLQAQALPVASPSPADHLAAHRAWLGWQYRQAPVLGREPFSVADVYIDTECGVLPWRAIGDEPGVDPFREDAGGRVPLADAVLDHLADPDLRDVVVVQGPAGSGKTAFCLHLADRLAAEGLTPFLVRFRDLRLSTYGQVDELLQDALRVAPVGESPPAPEGLLGRAQLSETVRFRGLEICRTVVILDGWDEVSVTGSLRFRDRIGELLPRVRQFFADRPGPPVRLVLTGRPSPAVEHSGALRRETPVLTIRPMRPAQLRRYAAAVSAHLDEGAWSLDVDRCEEAFTSYESWVAGSTDTGGDVLGSPLLALLAFRTLAAWPGDAAALFGRPTALYNALIEVTVANAGKADEGLQGTVHRGGRSLRRLLQQVAAVITNSGEESVSFEELRLRLDDDVLTDWANDVTKDTLHELVVNFYFKSNRELGCEFLHKSFREYLFAEAVVATLDRVSAGQSGSFAPRRRAELRRDFEAGTRHHRASRDLMALLGPRWLTPEVRSHLFWLVTRGVDHDVGRWLWIRDLLTDLYIWWFDSIHLRPVEARRRGRADWDAPPVVAMLDDLVPRDEVAEYLPRRTVSLDARFGDAIVQLCAFVHAEIRRPAERSRWPDATGRGRFRLTVPQVDDPNVARRVEARLRCGYERPSGDGLVSSYLRGIDLSGLHLSGMDLSECDLRGADLREVQGRRLSAHHADLRRVRADRASFVRADLRGAVLADGTLPAADLGFANLRSANLRGADLRDARLNGADLRDARLNDADLSASDLRGANLRDADLRGADLRGADLTDANLDGAHVDRI